MSSELPSDDDNNASMDEIPTRITDLLVSDFIEQNSDNLNRSELKNMSPSIIKGLGTVYGFRLEKLNIKTIEDLSNQTSLKFLTDKLAVDEETVLKWLLAGDIITEFSNGGENYRPILVAGLEGCGKSSLILSLKSMSTSIAPVPTKGIQKDEIEFLRVNVPIIELGGSLEQREKYISEPVKYLKGAMVLIFVIDVTRPTLMNENIEYLKNLVDSMKAIGDIPNLRVLLNKYDPQYKHQHDAVVTHVTSRVNEIFQKEYQIISNEIYKTSVFEIPTLIVAFSALFRDLTPISHIIASIYQYFAGLSSVYAGFVFTENGFVVSEWTKRLPIDRRNLIFDEAYNSIRKNPLNEDVHQQILKTEYQGIFVIIERIDIESVILYLASINTKAEAIGDQNLKLLRDQFKPWIKNFFATKNKRETFETDKEN
ncbi:MAG: ADP-ribosylation factor-like protein [Candidatus Thorarchaeota archaeon]